jgi:Tfp pilus assembly protein PilP
VPAPAAKPGDTTTKAPAPPAKPGQDVTKAQDPSSQASEPTKPAGTPGAAPAAKPAAGQAVKQAKETAPKYNVEDFAFNPEDARNPFEPVLLLKAKSSRGANVRTASVNRSKSAAKPEKADKLDYELEELRLVGVIKSATGMIAMMEDSQGKGVFFRKGDYLNQNLWVMDVSAAGVMLGYKAKGEIKKIAVNIPTKN